MELDIDVEDVVNRAERLAWAFVWALAKRWRTVGKGDSMDELAGFARARVLQEDSDDER